MIPWNAWNEIIQVDGQERAEPAARQSSLNKTRCEILQFNGSIHSQ